jgi:hypothetical protein
MDALVIGDSSSRCVSCMKSRWLCHSVANSIVHKHLMRPARNTVGSMVHVYPALSTKVGSLQSTKSSGWLLSVSLVIVVTEDVLEELGWSDGLRGEWGGFVVFHLYGSRVSSNSMMLLCLVRHRSL